MQKVRSRKAPVVGRTEKIVAPKSYLANSEGGSPGDTLQNVKSDLLTNGQVVWVKSQRALYVYSQTGTAPAFPLGVASSPAGCWRRVAPELYQFGAGAPTVDAAYVGQEYLDTTNDVWYKAVTTGTGASDWVSGGAPAGRSSSAVSVPIGAGYTTLLSLAAPVRDGNSVIIGVRFWHRADGGVRFGEDFRFMLERNGANYRLTTSDTSVTSVGVSPSITDLLDSGVGWRARVAVGILYLEQLQYGTPETAEACIWESEQSSV